MNGYSNTIVHDFAGLEILPPTLLHPFPNRLLTQFDATAFKWYESRNDVEGIMTHWDAETEVWEVYYSESRGNHWWDEV